MTNFVLCNPDLVFVHIPKTGGTSVKQALSGSVKHRFFGHLPTEYHSLPCFTVVRHPKSRFLSAISMFKFGNKLDGDYYSKPRWPDLTISKALDLLEDPWIGFDRSHRSLEWNLKHHLLPQCHPFNCVRFADYVLRQEHLDEDFVSLSDALSLPAFDLPKLRSKNSDAGLLDWDDHDQARFRRIFHTDFQQLGYESNRPTSKTRVVVPIQGTGETDKIYELWPSYFSDKVLEIEDAASAIPDPDCDLHVLAVSEVPGEPSKSWAGRSKNLIEHFQKLQPEMAGASRLSHLLVCLIVILRRDASCEPARRLFWRILDEHATIVVREVSLRWLVSVADTLADFGRTDAERAMGLSASIMVNSNKLHETELKLFYPKRPWPPKKRFSAGGPLFDGLITFWTEKGDLMSNMFQRIENVTQSVTPANLVMREAMTRLRKGSTVYRRFEAISGKPSAPQLDDENKMKFTRMFRRRL